MGGLDPRRALLVTRREVVSTVRTRSFLLYNLSLPLIFLVVPSIMFGLMSLPAFFGVEGGPRSRRTGDAEETSGMMSIADRLLSAVGLDAPWVIADETGHLGADLLDRLGDEVELATVLGPRELAALDARVRDGELGGWLHLDARTLESGWMAWHAPETDLKHLMLPMVQEQVRWAVVARELGAEGAERLARLRTGAIEQVEIEDSPPNRGDGPLDPTKTAHGNKDPFPGRVLRAFGDGALAILAFPMAFGMLFVPLIGASRVVKERQVGLVDLLTCAVAPLELVLGKTMAAMIIAACAIVLWTMIPALLTIVGIGVLAASGSGAAAWSLLDVISTGDLVVWTLLFSTNGFALLLVTVAASVTTTEQTSGLGLLGMLPMLALYPLMGILPLVQDAPDTTFAHVSSYVPVVGGPVMFVRWAESVALWEVLATCTLTLTTCATLAAAIIWIGRAAAVLGGWPRSLADLRRAWVTA